MRPLSGAVMVGTGNFTILDNIQPTTGNFLQSVAIGHYQPSTALQLAFSWHDESQGIRMLTVQPDPIQQQWRWRQISPLSQGEAYSPAATWIKMAISISCSAPNGCAMRAPVATKPGRHIRFSLSSWLIAIRSPILTMISGLMRSSVLERQHARQIGLV